MKRRIILLLFFLVPSIALAQRPPQKPYTDPFIPTPPALKDTTKIYDYTQGRRVWYVFPSISGIIASEYKDIGLGVDAGYGYFIKNRWLMSIDGFYFYHFCRPKSKFADYREFNIGIHTRYFFLKAAPRLYFYTGARLGLEFFTHRAEEDFLFYHDTPNGEWHTHVSKIFTPELGISVPLLRRYAFNFALTYNFELFRLSGRQSIPNGISFTLDYYIFMRKKKNKLF